MDYMGDDPQELATLLLYYQVVRHWGNDLTREVVQQYLEPYGYTVYKECRSPPLQILYMAYRYFSIPQTVPLPDV